MYESSMYALLNSYMIVVVFQLTLWSFTIMFSKNLKEWWFHILLSNVWMPSLFFLLIDLNCILWTKEGIFMSIINAFFKHLWHLGLRVKRIYSIFFLATNSCTILDVFYLLDYCYSNLIILHALTQISSLCWVPILWKKLCDSVFYN